MQVGNKPPPVQTPRDGGAINEKHEVENRADEVQLGREAQKAQQQQTPLARTDISPEKLQELSEPSKPADISAIVDAANPDTPSGFRHGLRERLVAVVASDFNKGEQQALCEYLERNTDPPEGMARLAWAKSRFYHLAMDNRDKDVTVLNEYFASKGLRLFPWDPLPEGHPGYQVDRKSFRAVVKKAVKEGGVLDRRTALDLLDRMASAVDLEDLQWCNLEIERQTKNGKLKFADRRTEKMVASFFEGRIEGQIGLKEIGWELRRLRLDGFGDAKIANIESIIQQCSKNADALFYCERQLKREINKGLKQAEKVGGVELEKVEAQVAKLRATLEPLFEKKLRGQFDRYTMEKQVERRFRKGQIDRKTMMALKVVVGTSVTRDDFVYGSMTAQVQLQKVKLQAQMMAAWSEVWDTISDNMPTGDERDAHGRIIETADERHQRKLRLRRLVERMRVEPQELRALKHRAWLRGSRLVLLSAVVGEKDPVRRASLESALANADIQLQDLDGPEAS